MDQQIKQLQEQVKELMEWKRQRLTQQLSYPVDDASRNALRVYVKTGLSTSSQTQNINLSGSAETITVPANPAGYLITETGEGQVLIPYFDV